MGMTDAYIRGVNQLQQIIDVSNSNSQLKKHPLALEDSFNSKLT